MSSPSPTRTQGDLAEMLETLLDKGVVINADIAVTVGDTELLGVQIRAAIASFETAAKYGMAFPSGTDMSRVHKAAGLDHIESTEDTNEEAHQNKKNDYRSVNRRASSEANNGSDDSSAVTEASEKHHKATQTDRFDEKGEN